MLSETKKSITNNITVRFLVGERVTLRASHVIDFDAMTAEKEVKMIA